MSAGKINWVLLKQIGRGESMRDISDETVKQGVAGDYSSRVEYNLMLICHRRHFAVIE